MAKSRKSKKGSKKPVPVVQENGADSSSENEAPVASKQQRQALKGKKAVVKDDASSSESDGEMGNQAEMKQPISDSDSDDSQSAADGATFSGNSMVMSDSDSDSEDEDIFGHNKGKIETKSGFESDFGHMAAFNTTPLDPKELSSSSNCNKYLRQNATENIKLLFCDLMDLPNEEEGKPTIKVLPEPVFRLPRQKIIPKPKPETRWEKFAKEKGIQKKKRDRMVWDEEKQAWAPRWGYQRANDDQQDWVIELKDGEDPNIDKFAQRRQEKKLRVMKNRERFLRNKAEANTPKEAIHAVTNLDVEGARSGASKRGKSKVVDTLKSAQVSTASLGRFDEAMEGEPKRQYGSKKRKYQANESLDDVDRNKKILGRLLGKHIGKSSSSAGSSEPNKRKRGKRGGKRK